MFGIVTVPSTPRRGSRGIILLNSGINYRIAWHCLNVKLARSLAEDGYPVLRFDTHGIGDSEGELPAGDIYAQYIAVETGGFVPDTLDAVNYFIRQGYCRSVVLAGLCGGAVTALLAATHDHRVRGVVHIAGPVTYSAKNRSDNLHPFVADDLLKLYLRKWLDPRSWLRMISGKSQYAAMRSALGVALRSRLPGKRAISAENGKALNTDFVEAFKRFRESGRRILFIFAGRDAATAEFEDFFARTYLATKCSSASLCIVRVIPRTNHIFSSEQAQTALRRILGEWLTIGEQHDRTVDLHRQLGGKGTPAPVPGIGV